MDIKTSIIIQWVFAALAFVVTILRCWVRICVEHRRLTVPDYLVWGGWACVFGWVLCSIKALHLQIDHPLVGEELVSDSVDYLTTVFVAIYFFDIGLFFPKASLIAFYWWLLPQGFRRLRIAVYICMGLLTAAFVATMLTDTLIAPHISDNWSIEHQMRSSWNSFRCFVIAWALNISTDIMLFAFPFFLLGDLKLRRRQMVGLVGVFSLGMITMIMSTARFVTYVATNFNVDDASGNLWCTAEMCTAVIVVSLPALKSLIAHTSPANLSNRNTNGYIQTGSSNPLGPKSGNSRIYNSGEEMDDEFELVSREHQVSASPSGASSRVRVDDVGGNVLVTTKVTIIRESV